MLFRSIDGARELALGNTPGGGWNNEAYFSGRIRTSGEVEIAAQQMPELHAVAGVDPTPLPDELQLIIPFVVGVSAAPQDAKATEELVAFFTGPAAGAVLKSKGLNPP